MNAALLVGLHLRSMTASSELVATTLLLAGGLVVTLALVLHDLPDAALVAAAVFWPALVFTGVHAVARGLARDADGGGLTATLLLPAARSTVLLARAAANALATFLLALVLLALFRVLLPGGVPALGAGMIGVAALGSLGIAAVATVSSFAALATTARDLVGPALALPMAMPVLIGGVHASLAFLSGEGLAAARPSLLFLAGYDVVLLGMITLLADAVMEAP